MKKTDTFSGTHFAVLGFGRSGRAVTDFLTDGKGRVTVYAETPVREVEAAPYRARGVRFCIGPFPEKFEGEVLVRSPGIRPDIPPILTSLAAGAVLTGETELFLERCRATVIGVTGSDGKTTTSALTAALLRGSGRHVLCGGNNGTPLLPHVAELTGRDFAVVELSSFQLMTLDRAPTVAVITNITPNHLNWHKDMAEYVAAKCRIFAGAGHLVTNADCPLTAKIARGVRVPLTLFSSSGSFPEIPAVRVFARDGAVYLQDEAGERRFDCGAFRLPGKHNLENLMAALAATAPYLNGDTVPGTLAAFGGVAHRLQYVDTVAGVAYYNSSIDTSPSRTAAALSALGGTPIVIAGGRGKGISLAPLAGTLAARAKAAFLYGDTAREILDLLGGEIPAAAFDTFAEAFAAAVAAAEPGDTVLLSPGCTAFGEFRDFEERGERFMQLVAALPRKG